MKSQTPQKLRNTSKISKPKKVRNQYGLAKNLIKVVPLAFVVLLSTVNLCAQQISYHPAGVYDISGIAFEGQSQQTNYGSNDFVFNMDGAKLYIPNNSSVAIEQYNVSIPFVLDDISLENS